MSELLVMRNLYDTSGNGNDGTTVDGDNDTGMDCTKSGKYGSACEFDGVDDVVISNLNNSTDNLGDTAGLMVTAWVYANNSGENDIGHIVSKQQNSGVGDWLLRVSSDSIRFQKDYSGTDLSVRTDYGTFAFGQWQHVAVFWSGSEDASEAVKIYINGIEASYGWQADGVGSKLSDADNSIHIGNNQYDSGTFDGLIDDVKIYNYARTNDQIIEDMNAGHRRRQSCGQSSGILEIR